MEGIGRATRLRHSNATLLRKADREPLGLENRWGHAAEPRKSKGVVHYGRRDVLRCAVTTSLIAAWVAQQLREAFPFDLASRLTHLGDV